MHTHTENHTRSSRAALMATLTKIIIVLLQLSLAATVFHQAQDSFERQSIVASGIPPASALAPPGREEVTS